MPKPTSRVHRMEHIRALIAGEHWVVEETKVQQVVRFLDDRSAGMELTEEELEGVAAAGQRDSDAKAYRVVEGVAVIPLHGTLAPRMDLMTSISGGTSLQTARAWVGDAIRDDKVRAILLDIDSPGGTVAGTAELANLVRSARGKKPIKAVASNVMASGAYWVGSAADEVIAGPSASIGSIGAFNIHWDESRRNENEGYKATLIKAGPHKALGSGVEPLSADGRNVLQESINDAYRMFVGAVAANRGVTTELVEERYGKGATMYAERAKAAGMVDRLGTLEDVLVEMIAATKQATGKQSTGKQVTTGGTGTGPIAQASAATTEVYMNEKLKAALVKAGLTTDQASDDVAQAALGAYCLGRGIKPEDTDAILASLEKPVDAPPAPPPVDTAAQAKRDEQIRRAELARIEDLEARAELLNQGGNEVVTAEQLKEAKEQGWDVAKALDEWTKAGSGRLSPVGRRQVRGGESSAEKFSKGALAVLCERFGVATEEGGEDYAASLHGASLVDLARESLKVHNYRVDGMDKHSIVNFAMRGSGQDVELVPSRKRGKDGKRAISYSVQGLQPQASGESGGAYNRPGDFPYLMSALMGRMLLEPLDDQETTYKEWTYRLAALPDFRPKTILELGGFGELPLHIDGEKFEGSPSPAESANWIAVDSYGDEWDLTPKMVVDDDLDGLSIVLDEKRRALERTINRLCITPLIGNPTMPDGTALFHANHTNLVDTGSGGVPSQAQFKKLRLNFRKQTGVNTNVKLNQRLHSILIPEDLEEDAERALAPPYDTYPTGASGVETFRGKVKWIVDAMLGSVSAAVWYAFANPAAAKSICYAHQQGFEALRVKTYFDPTTNNRTSQFECRVAAIARTHRGVQKNVGA